jgi:ribonucleoside-diphosphate reductase alpha chain
MISVIKRDGTSEPLDIEKLHKVVSFACEDIAGVSVSEVELNSKIQFYDNIKSSDIQETLIKSAADLISEASPNYQWVAGRLINYHLRKQVYGHYEPCSLLDLINKNIEKGFYDAAILDKYSKKELSKEIKKSLMLKS